MRALVIASLLLGACSDPVEAPVAGSAAAGASVVSAPALHFPATAEELPTTDWQIALGNVDAQIAGFESARRRDPSAIDWQLRLAAALLARGQALGRIADYEAALAVADEAVRRAPGDPDARLARAAARATLHRFADAGADLDAAAAAGASDERVEAARAAIWSATGREDRALAARSRLAAARPDLGTLGAEAMSLAALGRVQEAEQRFAEAQARFGDVTPLPLATLYFQAGLVEERLGRPASARALYEAARARLPRHAPATAHLATLLASAGRRAEAAALLRPLVAQSDDPEYSAALAMVSSGDEAARLRLAAARRYDQLMRRHPEAFADHAARFWLGVGGDPARALALAERNLALRPTADAHELAIAAALADGRAARACTLADAARALPTASAALQLSAYRAYKACARSQKAEQALAAAGG